MANPQDNNMVNSQANNNNNMSNPQDKTPNSIRRPQPKAEWIATDNYTISHLHPSSDAKTSILDTVLQHCTSKGLPPISASRTFAKFLALQAKALNAKHALEVGTLGGYTSISLALANPDLCITTLEVSPHNASVAQENINNAGVTSQISIRVGPALSTLPLILEEIEQGKLPKFDLVFIDADKANNWQYFDFAVKGARKGAVVLVDNVVQGGCVASEDEAWKMQEHVRGARTVIEEVGRDRRVSATVMQTVDEKGYDGFLFSVVL